jgi:hypothetical protein
VQCIIAGADRVGVRERLPICTLTTGRKLADLLSYQLQKQVPMRIMLCTTAAALLIATSSLAFAQDQSAVRPSNGANTPPVYGTTAPQPQPGYGTHVTGARAFGQPSPTMGMPGGNLPSASQHSS